MPAAADFHTQYPEGSETFAIDVSTTATNVVLDQAAKTTIVTINDVLVGAGAPWREHSNRTHTAKFVIPPEGVQRRLALAPPLRAHGLRPNPCSALLNPLAPSPSNARTQAYTRVNPRSLFSYMNTTEGATVYSAPAGSIIKWSWQLLSSTTGAVLTTSNSTYIRGFKPLLTAGLGPGVTTSGLSQVTVPCTPYASSPRVAVGSAYLALAATSSKSSLPFNATSYEYYWARNQSTTGCVQVRARARGRTSFCRGAPWPPAPIGRFQRCSAARVQRCIPTSPRR